MHILERSFYNRDTVTAARSLLGKILVHQVDGVCISGIIVETEAYCGRDDPASHAYGNKTPRNAAMFGDIGHAYVYFIYGNHFCFNIVAKVGDASAGAVLIRALEPVAGINQMQVNRKATNPRLLTNGPGRLTQALGITGEHNVVDLTKQKTLYVVDGTRVDSDQVVATPRIGIRRAQDKLWRFYIAGNQWVLQK